MEQNSKNILSINATDDSPSILIDYNECYIRIEGPSYPEDAIDTYQPVIDFINSYNHISSKLTVDLDFSILSSATNKMVYEIFIKLELLNSSGVNVTVNWFYEEFDEDLLEEGKSYRDTFSFAFELKKK